MNEFYPNRDDLADGRAYLVLNARMSVAQIATIAGRPEAEVQQLIELAKVAAARL